MLCRQSDRDPMANMLSCVLPCSAVFCVLSFRFVVGGCWQMLAALYQNFVVSGFGVEGDELKRYEGAQRKLAGILGLEDKVKMKARVICLGRLQRGARNL